MIDRLICGAIFIGLVVLFIAWAIGRDAGETS
jgi:hypothetical protein